MQSHCYTKVVTQEGERWTVASENFPSTCVELTDATVVCEMIAAKTKRKSFGRSLKKLSHCGTQGEERQKVTWLVPTNQYYLPFLPSGSSAVRMWLLCPWNFPGKSAGMGCHVLLLGISLTQGSNSRLLCLLHWLVDSLPAEPSRNPFKNRI